MAARGRVDSDNPGVREWAAQDLAGQQTWKGQVCRVSRSARYFVGALSPGYGLSDYREGGNHQDLHGEATLADGLKFRLFRAYSEGLWVSIFRRPLTFSWKQHRPAIFVATGIQSPFHRGERRVVFGSIFPNTPFVLGVLCVEKPNNPSFSPQRESRALSPIKRAVGLQKWSRWDVDLSTRRVLDGITALAHDQGSGFPLRREWRGGARYRRGASALMKSASARPPTLECDNPGIRTSPYEIPSGCGNLPKASNLQPGFYVLSTPPKPLKLTDGPHPAKATGFPGWTLSKQPGSSGTFAWCGSATSSLKAPNGCRF